MTPPPDAAAVKVIDLLEIFAAALGAGKSLSEARLAPPLTNQPPPICGGDVLFLQSRKYLFTESSARFSQEGLF